MVDVVVDVPPATKRWVVAHFESTYENPTLQRFLCASAISGLWGAIAEEMPAFSERDELELAFGAAIDAHGVLGAAPPWTRGQLAELLASQVAKRVGSPADRGTAALARELCG